MASLTDRIDQLSSRELHQALIFLSSAMLHDGDYVTQWSHDLRAALAEAVDAPAASPTTRTSEDEIARAALKLAAESPDLRPRLEVFLQPSPPGQPAAKSFGLPLGGDELAMLTAALVILQIRVQFERDSEGKWNVIIEKKALGDGAVMALIKKLLGLP